MNAIVDTFDTKNNQQHSERRSINTRQGSNSALLPTSSPEHGVTESEMLHLMQACYSQGLGYLQNTLQSRWTSAYHAYNNKHPGDSKYNSIRYRGRSRLFRPKTRATARKKSADAAAALFSTSDTIVVSPGNEADKMQVASADIIKELLNYRLDRAAEGASIPWFMVSMGAHHTALTTAVCISKQYWEYKTETVEVQEPFYNPFDPSQILAQTVRQEQRVVRDRPQVRLYPPENVIRDPAAAWEDQAQDSAYIILKQPMSVMEAKAFLDGSNKNGTVQFKSVPEELLRQAAAATGDDSGVSQSTRRARDQDGQDRLNDNREKTDNLAQVWLHENFLRVDGKDYVFWSLGQRDIISNIVPVADAYPEQGGNRPVVIGVATLEPFKIDPMAPIAAWLPMQQEINDFVNLRLDASKQAISPLTLVRRGRQVDIRAIQNRSPDSVAYVSDQTDVAFDRPPEPGPGAYAEMERLNADFDDQAGNFSIGSVQTNRSLNETVGGMNLMSGSANSMSEFDLRVWIETWCERVLRQLVKLEQYYEDDETILAIAANRAQLLQRFGVDQVTDELLQSQVLVSLNVGIGAADPMVMLNKMAMATDILGKVFGPEVFAGAKRDVIIDEVFGKAGYKNASERFFNEDEIQDPRLMQAAEMIQQLEAALAEAHKKLADKEADRKSKEKIAKLQTVATLAGKEMDAQSKKQAQAIDAVRGMTEQETNSEAQEMTEPADDDIEAMAQPDVYRDRLLSQSLERQGKAIQQGMEALARSFQQMNQGFALMAKATDRNTAAIMTPKVVRRGADGFAAAVVPQQ